MQIENHPVLYAMPLQWNGCTYVLHPMLKDTADACTYKGHSRMSARVKDTAGCLHVLRTQQDACTC